MLLVKYVAVCGDEFDVCGMQLFETPEELDEHWQVLSDSFKNGLETQEYYFGTNEFIEYESFTRLFEDHEVIYISSATYNMFKEIFNGTNFGWMPSSW